MLRRRKAVLVGVAVSFPAQQMHLYFGRPGASDAWPCFHTLAVQAFLDTAPFNSMPSCSLVEIA